MGEPKPSEVLRPLLDERGNVKGDSDTYRDKLFAILDRLDAEQRRLAAKVDGPAKPDTTPEAPKLAELACGGSELSVAGLLNSPKVTKSDLDSARAECERLRGLIREYVDVATKTLNDGLPKGAVR